MDLREAIQVALRVLDDIDYEEGDDEAKAVEVLAQWARDNEQPAVKTERSKMDRKLAEQCVVEILAPAWQEQRNEIVVQGSHSDGSWGCNSSVYPAELTSVAELVVASYLGHPGDEIDDDAPISNHEHEFVRVVDLDFEPTVLAEFNFVDTPMPALVGRVQFRGYADASTCWWMANSTVEDRSRKESVTWNTPTPGLRTNVAFTGRRRV